VQWTIKVNTRSSQKTIKLSLQPSGYYLYSTVVTICTAQWLLSVPHSGYYLYRQFNIQQFYVLPTQCVFCVDLRTNSDYFPIHWLVIATGTGSRYCAIRAQYYNEIHIFSLSRAQVKSVVNKVSLVRIFLRVLRLSLVHSSPPTFHTHLHRHGATIERTGRRSLGTPQKHSTWYASSLALNLVFRRPNKFVIVLKKTDKINTRIWNEVSSRIFPPLEGIQKRISQQAVGGKCISELKKMKSPARNEAQPDRGASVPKYRVKCINIARQADSVDLQLPN